MLIKLLIQNNTTTKLNINREPRHIAYVLLYAAFITDLI
jgi:hypothetical protein